MNALVDLARNLGGIIALVFYASIVLWTYKDARRRIEDPILIATAVALSMLPLVGVFVYMLLRPPEYIADVRERELEIRAMERTLGRQERCPYCRSHIEGDYLSCPICATKLRQACVTCDKPLDPRWKLCPFCETEVISRGPSPDRPGPGRGERRPSRDRDRERPSREVRGSSMTPPPRRAPRDTDARAAATTAPVPAVTQVVAPTPAPVPTPTMAPVAPVATPPVAAPATTLRATTQDVRTQPFQSLTPQQVQQAMQQQPPSSPPVGTGSTPERS